MLIGVTAGAAAQERKAAANDLGTSGLRTNADRDLARDLRTGQSRPIAAPYSTIREPLDREPEARREPSDDRAADGTPDEGKRPSVSRPVIDLFDEPEQTRQTKRNAAASPAQPAKGARQRPPSIARALAAGTAPEDRGAVASGDDLRPGAPLVGAIGRRSLPAEPVRSSRTETVNGRSPGRTAPLRATFPLAPDDPFAPIGLRIGGFLLYAALEQGAGYSSNSEETPNGADGAFSDTTLSARFASDWSRHAAELDMLTNYRRSFGGGTLSDPDVTVDGRLRLDVDRLTTATLRGGLLYRKEDAADLDPLAGGSERPDLLNYSAGADLEREFGRVLARSSVSAVRETTSDRGRASNVLDENFNTYTGALRLGYRVSPALAPFAEGSLGRRVFDAEKDALGRERAATVETLRGGVAFDLGEKLSGEVAVGYAWNQPDEGEFGTVSSPTVDARVAWSPQRGTDLALTAATTFDPDAAGSATATLYEIGVAARRRATARLDLDAALSAGHRDSQLATDDERTWGASAGFTYWMSRSLAFIGHASHDDVDRLNEPGDYDVQTIRLGLRFQN